MNTNITITCQTCSEDVDCRVGFSNRQHQPLSFSCPHCESPLGISLDISNVTNPTFSFHGCNPSESAAPQPFEGDNPFVDLHLDFPVRLGNYEMGKTPWMMALHDLQVAAGGDHQQAQAMYNFHNLRLTALNQLHGKIDDLKRLMNLYHGKNKQLFQLRASQFLEEDPQPSLLPQDLNATLYKVIAKAFFPFTEFADGKEISEGMPKFLYLLNRTRLNEFSDQLFVSNFLNGIQRDCLRIYPRILDAELSIRPALFLDWMQGVPTDRIATRVSAQDFLSAKDLYKDIVELIGRQLVLVAGLNNLYHRNDANSFKAIDGGALSNLDKFSAKPLSEKCKYLDDCWYKFDQNVLNLGLRNSIAHNNIVYERGAQLITYFPSGGTLSTTASETISYLAFIRLLLCAFREMHNLHHIVKSVLYFRYLIHQPAVSETDA